MRRCNRFVWMRLLRWNDSSRERPARAAASRPLTRWVMRCAGGAWRAELPCAGSGKQVASEAALPCAGGGKGPAAAPCTPRPGLRPWTPKECRLGGNVIGSCPWESRQLSRMAGA